MRVIVKLIPLLRVSLSTPGYANASQELRMSVGSRVTKRWYRDLRGYEHFDQDKQYSRFGITPRTKWWITGLSIAGGAYYWNCREEVPYMHRHHAIMFVSTKQEKVLGEMIFQMQKQEAAAAGNLLPEHHPFTQTVKAVGMKIADKATDGYGGGRYDHMKNLDWEFAVIRSSIPNAFVVPGGKVVVFTALLDLLQTEDELAAVLGHETAHVLARHHAERMSTMNVYSIAKFLFYLVFGFSIPNAVAFMGVFLPYSRRAEHEADLIGLRLMARACYDPVACTTMLSKLNAKERDMEKAVGKVPAFLRTHPLTERRVELVKKELAEAYELYHASNCEDVRGRLARAYGVLDELAIPVFLP